MIEKIWKITVNLIVSILSIFFSYLWPIFKNFTKIESAEINTILDVALYGFFISLLIQTLEWLFIRRMLFIDIDFLTDKQDNNKIVFYDNTDDLINCNINVSLKGNLRKFKENLIISCPSELTMQPMKRSNSKYLKETINGTEFSLDLNEVIKNSGGNIPLKKVFRFSLKMDEHNAGDNMQIKVVHKKYFFIKFDCQDLKIEFR